MSIELKRMSVGRPLSTTSNPIKASCKHHASHFIGRVPGNVSISDVLESERAIAVMLYTYSATRLGRVSCKST